MHPLTASLFLLSRLVTSSLAHDPPTSNPNRTLDETTDPDHGRLLNPSHAVLKLDCPGCPLYNSTWNDTATALIYDLRLVKTTTTPAPITLNSGPFFPAGPHLGFTPFTRHFALPVPAHTTISSYLASPLQYAPTEMAAIMDDEPVPNAHGWNITRIQCFNFGYGDFESGTKISIVDLYLLTPEAEGEERREWEMVWWELENTAVAYSRNRTRATMPKRLEEKLLGRDAGDGGVKVGLGMVAILLVVGVAVCGVTGAAAWVSTRYQNGTQRGIYRAIALDEPVWEDGEEEERELVGFRRSMTA